MVHVQAGLHDRLIIVRTPLDCLRQCTRPYTTSRPWHAEANRKYSTSLLSRRMANSEHFPCAAAYDYFLSSHTLPIDQFFTADQSRSLQNLLSAHHAYLFRCLYEMETHLEASLEELKSRQSKAEKDIAKINLLVENTRCNVLVVAKKLDKAINAYSGELLDSMRTES